MNSPFFRRLSFSTGAIFIALAAYTSFLAQTTDAAKVVKITKIEAIANGTGNPAEAIIDYPDTIDNEGRESEDKASVDYLNKFGYLKSGSGNTMVEDVFEQSVRDFQKFVGIPETGKIDALTTEYMKKPRCGNKDIEDKEFIDGRRDQKSGKKRSKRWVLYGPRWSRTRLTYRIRSYPRSLKNHTKEVSNLYKKAFDSWSKVTQLDFERRNGGRADIEIRFVRGEHGCEKGSLGAGTIAHAFFPKSNPNSVLDIHFDDNIDWKLNSSEGQSLYATALHEIGHSLGLAHSADKRSKMWNIENGLESLQPDDIKGIQQLYEVRGQRAIDKFHSLSGRRLSSSQLDLYDKSVKNKEDCAKYALNNTINLIVWDEKLKKCSIKRTNDKPDVKNVLFSDTGKFVGHFNTERSDHDISESYEDMLNWISHKQCDMILKSDNGKRTFYRCKIYQADNCCTMLFRLDKNNSLPDVTGVD